ncbi:adhesion G protein-coupled receptor L2-like isoform X3 [Acanthaster planci]|uniref:Adhesion G protein-coupled receptor L2-like isoform X3 n=1 Tax=Acanthaster planci TaxID=133434 RepID=A0A8B7YJQ2_ACAPL|nr:adhesion G protein-coupled receptor L2-like isoform X3 [Acanthaster planci]
MFEYKTVKTKHYLQLDISVYTVNNLQTAGVLRVFHQPLFISDKRDLRARQAKLGRFGEMEGGIALVFILSLGVAQGIGTTQNSFTSVQMSSRWDGRSPLWHNQTCDDLCGCVEGIMRGMRTPQICMEVIGYPCHLVKQLIRTTSVKSCSVTLGGKWFECDKGTTECVGGDLGVYEEENCTWSDSGAANTAYLGCETTVGKNSSVTCVLSRDSEVVGNCVNNAECFYKKVKKTDIVNERVSCPENWKPFKRHCLSPLMNHKTWNDAQNDCKRRWGASLLSLDSFGEYTLDGLKRRLSPVPDQKMWLGLFRDTVNTTFRWVDNTDITKPQTNWPWADDHPVSGLNYVYMLNKTFYSAESSQVHPYSCKIKVSKSLKCRQPKPTEMPWTTATDASYWTTVHPPTLPQPESSVEALMEELTQVRDDVSNYLKTFTNDTTALDAIDELISFPEDSRSNASSTSTQDSSTRIIVTLDSVVDSLAESINGPTEPLVISTAEIVLKVLTLCVECEGGEAPGGQLGNQSFSLSVPDSVKTAGATLALSTAGLLHEQLPSRVEDGGEKTRTEIGSLVSTISLRRWDGERVSLTEDEPLKITFSRLEKIPDSKPSCRYWKVSEGNKGVWSSEGCVVAQFNDTHTTCDITHLTSFAVIMRISHDKEPLPVILDYLTWAGCALSITCLSIMLIIFFSQRMYRADRNIIHMNLAISLLLAQLIFVFGIDRTENKGVCKSVGICVHFFLLATFFWMLNEGIFLLSKTTSAKTRWLRLPTYFTLGWVFPLVIVGVTMAASFGSYDTTERCWLTVQNGGIWAFVAPAATVVLINILVLVQVIRVFLSLRANMNKNKVERIRIALRAILLTLPLLGCTWLIGMLSFNSATLIFAYIFVVMNSLQGVFIFILYCLLNDEPQIKKGLRKRLALLQSLSGRTSHTRASRVTSGSNKTNRLSKSMPPEQDAARL